MTPGVELDAAVLRAMGWEYVNYVKKIWRTPTNEFVHVSSFSNITNGHEALRLCGPWLLEHTLRWGISQTNDGKTYAFGAVKHWAAYVNDVDGIGRAICDLVLAIAEREGT